MIETKLRQIQNDVETAAAGRSVKIVGVTKTVGSDRITEAYQAGLRSFGENRIQEAKEKIAQLSNLDIEWHFIGHLQTNKAKDAVRNFTWIHSIDSVKLLIKVEQEATRLQKVMKLLVELNLGQEDSKDGLAEEGLDRLLDQAKGLNSVEVCGLMIIPPFREDPEETRPYFRKLRELLKTKSVDHPNLKELSMGMSHDYKIAVEEGATIIRVGTLLFGGRDV
jgi:pyridoxal phosphate enzyme (YggS family)